MRGFIRLLLLGAVGYVSYKAGEKSAQLGALGFYVTRKIQSTPGVEVLEYITITPLGLIDYTQDQSQATSFYLGEAIKLRNLIQRYRPTMELNLITSETLNFI
jgi:hypothetical protein